MSVGLLAGTSMGRDFIDFNHHDHTAGWTRSADELGISGLAG